MAKPRKIIHPPPSFAELEAELRYCLSRFMERERREALNSYPLPTSRTEKAKLADWREFDRDSFELYERAERALRRES